MPETPYDVIVENQKQGLHTLVLLDLRPSEDRFMAVNEGIKILQEISAKKAKGKDFLGQKMIACARLGAKDSNIKYDNPKKLIKLDFGKPMHCLVIPGKMHFAEEEFLKLHK